MGLELLAKEGVHYMNQEQLIKEGLDYPTLLKQRGTEGLINALLFLVIWVSFNRWVMQANFTYWLGVLYGGGFLGFAAVFVGYPRLAAQFKQRRD